MLSLKSHRTLPQSVLVLSLLTLLATSAPDDTRFANASVSLEAGESVTVTLSGNRQAVRPATRSWIDIGITRPVGVDAGSPDAGTAATLVVTVGGMTETTTSGGRIVEDWHRLCDRRDGCSLAIALRNSADSPATINLNAGAFRNDAGGLVCGNQYDPEARLEFSTP
ncbi:MAG: hypothetical protein AAGE52_18010 [Myxococcota bacterium]